MEVAAGGGMGYVPPLDTLSKPPLPTPPPPRHHHYLHQLPPLQLPAAPPGRNKQASDRGTSSCSPTRNRRTREALGAFFQKKKKTQPKWSQLVSPVSRSDTRIFLITEKHPSIPFYSGQSGVLAFEKRKLRENGRLFLIPGRVGDINKAFQFI